MIRNVVVDVQRPTPESKNLTAVVHSADTPVAATSTSPAYPQTENPDVVLPIYEVDIPFASDYSVDVRTTARGMYSSSADFTRSHFLSTDSWTSEIAVTSNSSAGTHEPRPPQYKCTISAVICRETWNKFLLEKPAGSAEAELQLPVDLDTDDHLFVFSFADGSRETIHGRLRVSVKSGGVWL